MGLVAFTAGLGVTPLLEYAWHAWVAHGHRPDVTRDEHLEHHRTAYTVRDPWEEMGANALRVVGSVIAVNALLAPLLGLRRTVPLGVGLALGYAASTLYHAQMHERAPRTRYEDWMWRFHWHHHAADARRNFGLTNPLFDFVFGTAFVPAEVVLPERLAPVWLTADRPGFKIRRAPAADTSA